MICSTIAFSNCSSAPSSNNGNVVVTNSNSTTKPAGDTTKTETATTSGDKIGVPECDEYIEKYETCLTSIADKYPQIHPNLKTAFEAQRKGFKDAASTPQGKTALAGQCKQFIDSAKQATSAYACKW
jgi:hypothetical protein